MTKHTWRAAFVMLICLFTQLSVSAQGVKEVRAMIEAEKYKAALQAAEAAVADNEKDPALHYVKGLALLSLDRVDEALTAFEMGIDKKPKYPLNYIGKARVFLANKDEASAQSLMTNSYARYNKYKYNDLDMVLDIGYGFMDANQFIEAEQIFTKATVDAPNDARAVVALGDMYLSKKIYELALTNYQQAVQLDPNFIRGYLRIGQLYIKNADAQEDYQEGLNMLNKAIELDDSFAPAYRERGELRFRAKQYTMARDDYKKYVELRNNDLGARVRYASFLYLSSSHFQDAYKKDESKAEEIKENYKQVVDCITELESDTVTNVMRRLKAYSLVELGEAETAMKMLDDYFANMEAEYIIAPDHEYYAKALFSLDKYDEAEARYAKVLELDSSRVDIYKTLASSYEAKKMFDKQAANLEKYLEVAEEKTLRDYYYLGRAHYKAKDYQKSYDAFKMVVELKDDYDVGHYWLALNATKMDPENKQWLAKPHYDRLVELIEAKESKSSSDTKKLEAAYVYIAYYYFFGSTGEGSDCEAAKPYISRVIGLNAANAQISQIADFCNK